MAMELLAPLPLILAGAVVLRFFPHYSLFFSLALYFAVVYFDWLRGSLVACLSPGLFLLCYSAMAIRKEKIQLILDGEKKAIRDDRHSFNFTLHIVLFILAGKVLLILGALLYWGQKYFPK